LDFGFWILDFGFWIYQVQTLLLAIWGFRLLFKSKRQNWFIGKVNQKSKI
jgi:hypothetical protein